MRAETPAGNHIHLCKSQHIYRFLEFILVHQFDSKDSKFGFCAGGIANPHSVGVSRFFFVAKAFIEWNQVVFAIQGHLVSAQGPAQVSNDVHNTFKK